MLRALLTESVGIIPSSSPRKHIIANVYVSENSPSVSMGTANAGNPFLVAKNAVGSRLRTGVRKPSNAGGANGFDFLSRAPNAAQLFTGATVVCRTTLAPILAPQLNIVVNNQARDTGLRKIIQLAVEVIKTS